VNPVRALPGLDTSPRIASTVTVVAVVAVAEVAIAWRFGWTPTLAAYAYLAAIGVVVSGTDLADRRIPNMIVLPAYLISPVLLAVASVSSGAWWPLARAAIAMVVLGGFYLALGLVFPAGVGLGDVKWAGVIGGYLGWLEWSAVASGTLIAFLAAAAALAVGRLAGPRRATLAMAPFMTFGALVAILSAK
jgi:leader peptidase (prepilin peptidase)/N-methyltransferase